MLLKYLCHPDSNDKEIDFCVISGKSALFGKPEHWSLWRSSLEFIFCGDILCMPLVVAEISYPLNKYGGDVLHVVIFTFL